MEDEKKTDVFAKETCAALKFLAVLVVAVLFFIAVFWAVGVLLDDLH